MPPERDAYSYARVKATMTLRKSGQRRGTSGLRHRRFSLPALLLAASVLVTFVAGASSAGVASYQGTLHLDGAPGAVGGNWLLTTSTGAAQGAAPVATAGAPGSGGVTGTYTYIYVTAGGGASTASLASGQAAPNNAPVSVASVPIGADVYRQRVVSSAPQNNYIYIGTAAATPYVDTNPTTTGAALPQADNRPAVGATGWTEFTPGVGLAASTSMSTMTATAPSTPSVCKGWMVDAPGGVSFPAGTWTFQARIRPGGNNNGTAVLTAALYRVNDSGVPLSTVVAPSDGAANMINTLGTAGTYSVSAAASAFTLDTNEHLCVMFWRHQTGAYTGGGATARQIALLGWDPANQVSLHPAPNAFATAALAAPADGLHAQTTPTLGATYSDTEGDAGNVTIRVCPDAGCSSSTTSGQLAATNGQTRTWVPTGLTDGTYYWSARAKDATGLPSGWTANRGFTIDTVAPTTSFDSIPSANSNAASGTFAFHAGEPVTGFQCHVDAAPFASCSSPAGYGPLADGTHTFYVRAAADLAGNVGTTASSTWAIDTAPPDTSIAAHPAALSSSAAPSFSFTATEPGSSFECKLDAGAFAACSTPKSYSSVADGAHTFQVRAIDPSGNVDPSSASYTWTIDATPPDTSIGPGRPAALTTATSATFDFSSTEAGSTFACSLDGAAFTACSTPRTYSGLADGGHTFQVRATDTATNTDPTPAVYTWTVDTIPPVSSIGPATPAAHTSSTSASFDLLSNEAGSTFECRLDSSAYSPCTTPKTYTALGDGAHTFDVRATDPVGNLDTTPASYAWSIDNVAPAMPTLAAPADAALTNVIPQLRASFDDATAGGDTGTIQFQLCSNAASAGPACAPLVQSATSSSLAAGGIASWAPSALPGGIYHWQARATDAAGNQSGWSATHSFQLDTSAPAVPGEASPADGAWVSRIELKSTFSKPSFAGTGALEFRLCSAGMCLWFVRSGTSGLLVNGNQTAWSPATQPGDGLWYWRVRSHDSAGNTSAWSPTHVLHLDSVAPGKPLHFNGQIAGGGLTLRWDAPGDTIANYVVFVDGAPWKNLGGTELEVKMGAFDASDARTFSVVAVDLAGNVGAMSPVLVGVPNTIGLDWAHAQSAAAARGLTLKRDVAAFASVPMLVTKQDPAAPALVERHSSLSVSLESVKSAPLAVRVRPGRVSCTRGCVLRLRIELSSSAVVRARLLTGRGRVVKRDLLGTLPAGANTIRVTVPKHLAKGAYRLLLDASGDN